MVFRTPHLAVLSAKREWRKRLVKRVALYPEQWLDRVRPGKASGFQL